MKNLLVLSALSVFFMPAATTQAQRPAYTIQNLGTLGGGTSGASGINSKGEVVGDSYTANGSDRPFLYSNGVMQDLGTLYGPQGYYPPYPQGDRGGANAISDNGLIVGTTYKYTQINPATVQYSNPGFRYSNGTMTEFDSGSILGVNNAGQSVGRDTRVVNGVAIGSYASLYSNGVEVDLGLGDGSSANAINNHGQIVGRAGQIGAYLYENGSARSLGLPSGFLGSGANAISDSGIVAGLISKSDGTLSGVYHAALWQNGQALDLGTLGGKYSTAYGVNSAGVVVGEADRNLVNQLQSTAFVYENGVMYDLFAGTGWSGGSASAINDAGQIVGTGVYNGAIRAFLATPVAVPEPGAWTGFSAGRVVAWLAAAPPETLMPNRSVRRPAIESGILY